MNKLLLSVLLLGSVACISATSDSIQISGGVEAGQLEPFATTISRWLVETVSQKIIALARHFHLKLRLVRFFVSLYTTENLMLLRNLIEHGVELANFALRFLPATTEDPGYQWISALSQFLNVDTGHGGILGLVLGEPKDPSQDDPAEASSENMEKVITDPPIFYNPSVDNTKLSDFNEVGTDSIRSSRSTVREPNYVNEQDPEIADKEEKPHEILKTYQRSIMSLDKLINSRRK